MQIVLVKLHARSKQAVHFQEILTKHGCDIAMRLGLHEFANPQCSDEGVILLQLKEDSKAVSGLEEDLLAMGNITVKSVSM